MAKRFISVTGFVLAGGASRRMGRDKVQLLLAGETLLARQVRLLSGVCRSVTVVGPAQVFPQLGARIIPDAIPGCGPLGGIFTGLHRTRTEYNLILGCDLPFLTPRFLRFLAERALESRADVTLAQSPDRKLQPLCAVWRRQTLSRLRLSLQAGKFKTGAFCQRATCRVLPWAELARARFTPRLFANLNSPGDYEAAVRAMGPAVVCRKG